MRKHSATSASSREAIKTTQKTLGEPAKVLSQNIPVTSGVTGIPAIFGEMERMFDEFMHRPFTGMGMIPMRQLFHDFGGFGEYIPVVDLFEDGNEVVLRAELAGMRRDDINVRLHENSIIISGEKKSEEKVERKDFLRLERSYGSFNRTVSLPENIDVGKAKATFKDGLLEVRIPKSERKESVRRVPIE